MFFKQSKQEKAEKLFKKTLTKHNQLLEFEKIGIGSKEISFIEMLIIDYSMVLELSPKQKSVFQNRGSAQSSLARIYMNLDKKEKALEVFDLAMRDFTQALYLDESNEEIYMYMAILNYNLYKIYKKMSKNDFALQHLKYVMEDYNRLLKILDKNRIKFIIAEKALVEFDFAEMYLLLNKEEKALVCFQNSINYYLQILKKISEQNDIEAIFNIALGQFKMFSIYKKRKEYHFAGISLEESNCYFIKLLNYSLEGSSFNRASILFDISENMSEMGKLLESLEDYSNAISSYEESIEYANKSLAIEPLALETLSNLTNSKINIGKILHLLGKNREAIVVFEEGINDFLTLLSFFPEDIISLNTLAITYIKLANIYREKMIKEEDEIAIKKVESSYLNAIKQYDKALEIDEKDTESYSNKAASYNELAIFYIYIKENKKAIKILKKSLNLLNRVLKMDKNLPILENIHAVKLTMAEAYEQEDKVDKALNILEEALDSQGSKNRASILAKIGRLYLKQGLNDKAVKPFDEAFNLYVISLVQYPNNLMILENLSLLLENILKISNHIGYIDRAITCNQKIIEVYNDYFVDIGFEEDAFSVTSKMSIALNRLLDAYVDGNKKADENLVKILECVKAKRLKQLLVSNQFPNEAMSFNKSDKLKIEKIKIKLNILKREIRDYESFSVSTSNTSDELYERFQDYSQELSKLLQVKEDKPMELYKNLDKNSVIIYPIEHRQKLTVVSVTKDDVKIVQVAIQSNIKFSDYLLFIKYLENLFSLHETLNEELLIEMNNIRIDEEIKRYVLQIDREEFIFEYKYKILGIALSHIGDTIIEAIPKRVNKVLFSAFGDLNLLPLHAISRENDYLIEKYEISYIPSLAIASQIKSDLSTNDVIYKDNLFVSMEGLHHEAEESKVVIGGEHLKNIEADKFKNYVYGKKYNILHFSTHGSANLLNPLNAYLQFNNSSLYLFDIYGLNIDVNLVNISACETYLSKLEGADEVLAFERAFLIAGAKSVISTFSTVDNSRTEDFMKFFYSRFVDSHFISKNFQEACIEDIENGSMEWSLFRFTGS